MKSVLNIEGYCSIEHNLSSGIHKCLCRPLSFHQRILCQLPFAYITATKKDGSAFNGYLFHIEQQIMWFSSILSRKAVVKNLQQISTILPSVYWVPYVTPDFSKRGGSSIWLRMRITSFSVVGKGKFRISGPGRELANGRLQAT